MKKNQLFLGMFIVVMVAACGFAGLKYLYHNDTSATGPLLPVNEKPQTPGDDEDVNKKEEPKEKVYVNVFFIGQNDSKEEVYKAVKREYDKDVDGSKIKYAVNALIAGPKQAEKAKGVYSEIPAGTKVISVTEQADRVIVNLNSTFETGGGTDSIYKRLYQLIRTTRQNTTKPVYLYINGQKADVIGGEGIMINQPLNDKSLDG